MANNVTHSEIQKLSKHKNQPSISIFMNTDGNDFAYNRAKLKYLLSHARSELTKYATYKEKHESLYPAYRLLHDQKWWTNGYHKSVAIFSTIDDIHAYKMADSTDEEFVVSNRFHILPLINKLNHDGSFLILTLSKRNSRLLLVEGDSVRELNIANMPHAIEDALRHKDPERFLQSHAKRRSSLKGKVSSLAFHANIGIKDREKVETLEYFTQIEKAIKPVLNRQNLPLVLVGLPKVQAIYRKVNSYKKLHDESVTINPDRYSSIELRDKAYHTVAELFMEDEVKAQSQFLRMSVMNPKRVKTGVVDVLSAAKEGKVQTLFVDPTARLWGKLRKTTVEVHKQHRAGDSNLLDIAAAEALEHDGQVYNLESSDLPEGSYAAAILRY